MSGARGGLRIALAAALLAAAGCSDTSIGTSQAWVEIGPDGEAIARVVTDAAQCPDLEVDGSTTAMATRAAPDPPAFPVLTCEAAIPAGARRAAVGGVAVPLPPAEPERIAVLGDTGCRLETGDPTQPCNDPQAWPFAEVARSVAAFGPDLIVHVGDYLYREDPCPPGDDGCAGSPSGDNWPAIEADFFVPGQPLFAAAPLVVTRGNHESCSRGGAVWFRFLDPRPFPDGCVNYTEPYAVEVGSLQFLMLDSSAASDTSVDPAQVALYRQQFAAVARLAGPRSMFVTHRPMWAFGHLGEQNGMEVLFRDNPTLQAGSDNVLPSGVEAVLSGHIHIFELLSFAASRPPQLVVGNGGTELDPPIATPLTGLEIAGAVVNEGVTRDAFGFLTLERDGAGWRATLRDVGGASVLECAIAGGQARCT